MRTSRPIHEPPEPVPVDPRPSRVETDLATLEIGHGFTLGNLAYPPRGNSEGDRVVYITRPSTVPGCEDVIEYTIHGRGRSGVIDGAAFIAYPAMREIAQRDPQQYGFTPGTWLSNDFRSTMMHIEWESVQPASREFRANATEESIHWPYSAALDYATTIYPRRADEDFSLFIALSNRSSVRRMPSRSEGRESPDRDFLASRHSLSMRCFLVNMRARIACTQPCRKQETRTRPITPLQSKPFLGACRKRSSSEASGCRGRWYAAVIRVDRIHVGEPDRDSFRDRTGTGRRTVGDGTGT